jgi:hypothetical protein
MKWAVMLIAVIACGSCMSFSNLLPVLPPIADTAIGASLSLGVSKEDVAMPTVSIDFRYRINDSVDIGLSLAPGVLFIAGETVPYLIYHYEADSSSTISAFIGIPFSWAAYNPEALRLDFGATYSRQLQPDNYLMFSVAFDPVLTRDKSLDGADEVPNLPFALRDQFPLMIGIQNVIVFHPQTDREILWANQIVLYHLKLLGFSSGVFFSPVK